MAQGTQRKPEAAHLLDWLNLQHTGWLYIVQAGCTSYRLTCFAPSDICPLSLSHPLLLREKHMLHNTEPLPQGNLSDLLNEICAAPFVGLKVKTLQAWRVSGQGPKYLKLGPGKRAAVRYRRSDLIAFLAECQCTSTAEHSARGAA